MRLTRLILFICTACTLGILGFGYKLPVAVYAKRQAYAAEDVVTSQTSDAAKQWEHNYRMSYGKIRNPYDQWFDPDEFRFEDYSANACTEWEVLAKLFPVGTPKAFVDRVMVTAGGATVTATKMKPGEYSYFVALNPHDSPLIFMTTTWNVIVSYDDRDMVKGVQMKGRSAYDFTQNCQIERDYGRNWRRK